ncbi:ribonuclease Oy isoform X2 [Linepithema humile]|uniref:ribonuclease Oy isoform X2 n=1 Tax=Linepithema humile TaxID=83485 RepID=UPI00062378C7|nr:PREDICTED: ribonuclease Oy isoform X2 [Linepithema humile]
MVLYVSCFRSVSRQWRRQTSADFDVLIFTERWPLTACFVWKENSESHSCLLPKRDEWTIHGIWPTKYNTMGPQYCDRSLPFNASALAPIENELKENWIDIQNGSKPYTFWKHEWDKHGTCAVVIEALNSELNYFEKGLKLLDTYNMIVVLAKANILPGETYTIDVMLTAIEEVLGKRGQITCAKHEKTGESYVNEIRICFDKSLQLTNCDGIYNFPTNCDRNKQIIYPSYVPRYLAKQM